tara:strand:- start:312 stop:563 length:252 start_codon:yes stop_codon:yes gene_type:complete
MNTSIVSSNATANSLTSLMNTYDEIDITNVLKITGSIDSVTDIIDSNKFLGSHTSDLVITEPMTNEQLKYFEASTSGKVELQQ